MTTGRTVEDLSVQVEQLEKRFRQRMEVAKSRTRVTAILATALVVTVLGFVAYDYWHLRSEWTAESLQVSLSRELEDLAPAARLELDQLGREVMPIYLDEARNQLRERWPAMSLQLREEADQVRQASAAHARDTLQGSHDRLLARLEREIRGSMPEITDPAHRQDLNTYFAQTCERAVSDSIENFYQRFESRLDGSRNSIARFDSHREDDSVDLNKRFIQLWLQLLEEEVMSQ